MVDPDLLGRRHAGGEGEILLRQVGARDLARAGGGIVTTKPPRFNAAFTRGSAKNGAFSEPISPWTAAAPGADRVAGGAEDPVPDADDEQDGEADRGEAPRALVRHLFRSAGRVRAWRNGVNPSLFRKVARSSWRPSLTGRVSGLRPNPAESRSCPEPAAGKRGALRAIPAAARNGNRSGSRRSRFAAVPVKGRPDERTVFCHASRASITSAAPTTLTLPTHDLDAGAAGRGNSLFVLYPSRPLLRQGF